MTVAKERILNGRFAKEFTLLCKASGEAVRAGQSKRVGRRRDAGEVKAGTEDIVTSQCTTLLAVTCTSPYSSVSCIVQQTIVDPTDARIRKFAIERFP